MSNAFDVARGTFAAAQRAMESAAIAELGRVVREAHPDAVEVKVRGYYGEEGDLVIDLVSITTPSGVLAAEEAEEDANDALLYLGTTMSEGYLGTHEIVLPALDRTGVIGGDRDEGTAVYGGQRWRLRAEGFRDDTEQVPVYSLVPDDESSAGGADDG